MKNPEIKIKYDEDFRTRKTALIGALNRFILNYSTVGAHNYETGKIAKFHLEQLEKEAETVLLLCEIMASHASGIKRLG